MNLPSKIKDHAEPTDRLAGGLARRALKLGRWLAGFAAGAAVLSSAAAVTAQTNFYSPSGFEYPIIGSLFGDQAEPAAAISPTGGFVVWQDNITDGDGLGISAERVDATLSGSMSPFRVNVAGAGNQENPRVALLKNGGAVFAWQGGALGRQHIYARFLSPTNTFLTATDVLVGTFTNTFQANPAVAVLNNGNVVMVWSSYNQVSATSMQDVYGQLFSPTGQKIGGNFLMNQFTSFNQRSPSVAALKNGGFLAAWVSEQQRALVTTGLDQTNGTSTTLVAAPSVDIYARQFAASGSPSGSEFLVNADNNPCANPAVAAAGDGSCLIAWTARDTANPNNSLDIHGRIIANGAPASAAFYINATFYGDQYIPQVSAIGQDYLVTWTSLGQDGSREGIYGRFVHSDGTTTGGEFLVNTTTLGQQMQPAVASDGVSSFLVVWTSFSGYPNTFDLYAQRYQNSAAVLPPMSAPYVWAPFATSNNVYAPQLVVTWAPVQGYAVSNYEVFVDGGGSPMGVTTGNQWVMTAANGLTTNATHTFAVDYVTTDGRRPSRLSPATSGTTWSGQSWGGIPFEWMQAYYGNLNVVFGPNGPAYNWPTPNSPLTPGGYTPLQVFVSGGNPTDASTWLHQTLQTTAQGLFLSWNTQPGAIYQVQNSTNFQAWTNLGSPRFASGQQDSIYVGGSPVGYYRVVLMR